MKRPTLGALLLVIALNGGTSIAANSSKKTEPRLSIKIVAEYVFKYGVDQNIPPQLSRSLGLGDSDTPVKALRHKSSVSPDNRAHAFLVVYGPDRNGKRVPTEIVLSNALITKKDDKKYVVGFDARTDLKGKLLGAVSSEGPLGEVTQQILPTDSHEAVTGTKEEYALHLKKMDYLKLSK